MSHTANRLLPILQWAFHYPTGAQALFRLSLCIRWLFALCLLAATFNHLHAAFAHGLLWDYGYGSDTPLVSRAFWGSLTLLDPLAVLLLWRRPRWGLALTLAIIVLDVLHNSLYVAAHEQWLASFYLSQVGFLVLVLLLTPLAWRGLAGTGQARCQRLPG